MAYTRQYTQGVGWENTPSINTPISAENLNQMDAAIQDVDEAAYNEFLAVYAAIAQAGGNSRPLSEHIVSVDSNLPILNTSNAEIGTFNFENWEFLFLRCDVDAHYDSEWALNWSILAGGTTYIGTILDYRDYYLGGSDFKEDIPAGSTLVLALVRSGATGTVWGLYAIIPAASSGGCRIFSDHITEQDDTNLYTSTNVFDGTSSQDGDLLFLRCDVDAVWPSPPLPLPGWGISFGHGSVEYGSITDARRGEGSVMPGFYDSISSGTTLIISKHGNNDWFLRAVIPVASSGGTHTDAINFKITSASSNTLVPVAFQRIAEPLNDGDLVFLYMSVNGTFDSEASATSWQLQYKLTDSTTITGSIANGLGSPSVSIFNSNLPQGTWLVLKSGVYDSTTHTQGFTCIAKIDPASGGGTTVVANPTGTATDTLEKLQVGSTIYEIPGIDTAWAGKVTAVSGGNITPNNAFFSFDPFTDGKFVILDIGVDAVKPGGVTSWSLQYTVDGNTVTRSIADKRDGNAYDPNFDDDLVSGSVIVLQYFGDNEFACVAVLNESGGGGASTLAGLSDTNISSPTAAQPLTYDATNSKWINGGIIPAANGGTGNNTGYVQAGRKANTTIGLNATAEGQNTTASGARSHSEGYDTKATATNAHAEGSGTTASNGASHAEGSLTTASGNYSHAQNRNTVASAESSSAAGNYTTAGYANQFVVGKYNDNKSTNIFEVGIGTANNAKANGLELDTSGNLKTAGTVTDSSGAPLAPSSALAPVENGATASQAYASGEHFMRNGKFCTATTAIASGDTLTVGTNYSEGNVAGSLGGGGGSSTLAGLTDTAITTPTNGQVLTYDAANDKWINAASGGGGLDASIIGTEETESTASQVYQKGDYFIKNDKLCVALAYINSGATFTLDTNYAESNVSSELLKIKNKDIGVGGGSFSSSYLDVYCALTTSSSIVNDVLKGQFLPLIDFSKITTGTKVYVHRRDKNSQRTENIYMTHLTEIDRRYDSSEGYITTYYFVSFANTTGNYFAISFENIGTSNPSVAVSNMGSYNGSSSSKNAFGDTTSVISGGTGVPWIGIKY